MVSSSVGYVQCFVFELQYIVLALHTGLIVVHCPLALHISSAYNEQMAITTPFVRRLSCSHVVVKRNLYSNRSSVPLFKFVYECI